MTAECLTEEAANYQAPLDPPDLVWLWDWPIPRPRLLFQPSLSDVWNIDPHRALSGLDLLH